MSSFDLILSICGTDVGPVRVLFLERFLAGLCLLAFLLVRVELHRLGHGGGVEGALCVSADALSSLALLLFDLLVVDVHCTRAWDLRCLELRSEHFVGHRRLGLALLRDPLLLVLPEGERSLTLARDLDGASAHSSPARHLGFAE